jgi:hypothetical protein
MAGEAEVGRVGANDCDLGPIELISQAGGAVGM